MKLVFKKDDPATDQVLFALKYLNRGAKSYEILDAIKEFDPSFDKGLSTPLYKLKDDMKKIETYNPTKTADNPEGSKHSVYYGLVEWFESKNRLKEEYMPDLTAF